VRGLAVAVLLWLLFAVVYDGLVLLLLNVFADYPLEKPMIGLMLLNPVDLARVLLLLSFDASALMGYTGAVFEKFFGSALGIGLSAAALGVWLLVPLALGRRFFKKKDF
jgi:Cu-processing system permease protein